MKQKKFALLLLLLVSQLGFSDDWFHQAIKVDNPNELAYWVDVSKSCLVTIEALQGIVEGVFIRSRIKPLKEAIFEPGRIYLYIDLQCTNIRENIKIQTYGVIIKFARYNPKPSISYDGKWGNWAK